MVPSLSFPITTIMVFEFNLKDLFSILRNLIYKQEKIFYVFKEIVPVDRKKVDW